MKSGISTNVAKSMLAAQPLMCCLKCVHMCIVRIDHKTLRYVCKHVGVTPSMIVDTVCGSARPSSSAGRCPAHPFVSPCRAMPSTQPFMTVSLVRPRQVRSSAIMPLAGLSRKHLSTLVHSYACESNSEFQNPCHCMSAVCTCALSALITHRLPSFARMWMLLQA